MTILLAHGVPETTAVWDPLIAALGRDDVAVPALPGFGSPLPAGFEPTMATYADWFAEELARHDEVDLVGHDWGGLLALRVLADRPANVRSWVLDMGDLDPTFRWHDTALVWQTPGDGEAMMDGLLAASVEERAAVLEAVGVPADGSRTMAEGVDRTMTDAILSLYRSATDIGNEWGPGIDRIEGPGLLVASMQDRFRSPARVTKLAERTGAAVIELPDAGHWWMLQDPPEVARFLEAFWAGL